MIAALSEVGFVDWANTVVGVVGLSAAGFALLQTRRSNRTADEANTISRGANDLAGQANRHAERALQLQEEEGKVRLVVKPRMLMLISSDPDDEDDRRPRPVVEVVNLSAFPVTVTAIHFKRADGKGLFWKNPAVANPYGQLPARLPSREALTALGVPATFENLEALASVTAAAAYTACGEEFVGMTDQWREEVARMVAEGDGGAAAKKPKGGADRGRM